MLLAGPCRFTRRTVGCVKRDSEGGHNFVGELDLCNGGWSPSSTSSVHLTVLADRVEGCVAGHRAAIRPIPPSAATPCQSLPRAAHRGGLAARVE